MKKLYNVIKKNLGVAQSLIYVVQFNQPNGDKELRLGSGDLDWEQWQVQEISVGMYFINPLVTTLKTCWVVLVVVWYMCQIHTRLFT